MVIKESIELNGKQISLETGRLAKQASGAVLASYGDTRVLVTVCMQESREDIDYFPLRVDYEERFYASGKIPGGFFKREGRPSDVAILAARMIDRPIRPLFPNGYSDEVQIIATVLSAEPDCSPSMLSILGASAALMISEAPFNGPIAGVQVGYKDGQFVVNPGSELQEEGNMEITVAGTKQTVTMVEGQMKELSEEEVVSAIGVAHEAIQELVSLQERFIMQVNPAKKELPAAPQENTSLRERIAALINPEFSSLVSLSNKKERADFLHSLRDHAVESIVTDEIAVDEAPALQKEVVSLVDDLYRTYMRTQILDRGVRIDGRRPDEIRNITCEVGVLPRAHGSAIFTRGETQSLGIATLGATRGDEQIIDQMLKEGTKRFMLHYNFPPYSVGEVRRVGSPSRRSIGHGYLAEGGLRAILPSEEEFPYVIRIVSEILESNGSSSMATVCSGSLAMMDAGVPIKKPVAGIAMGMIEDESTQRRVILTDILGDEDHYGDMDFKVIGTRDGITGFQLDVKVGGIGRDTLRKALQQARQARLEILAKMEQVLPAPRETLSMYAPRLETITIPREKIGLVIGPGGKMIRKIIEETGAQIDIEDDGTVKLASVDMESVEAAKRWVEDLTAEIEVGTKMTTKVTRVVDFGAFVDLKNGSEGLVHVSNLAPGFVDNVRDIVKPGDEITIEVIGEDKMGRPDLRRVIEGANWDEGSSHGRGAKHSRGNGSNGHHAPKKVDPSIKVGDIIEGTIANTTDYGAFVELTPEVTGLIHISALSNEYVRRVSDVVKPGDKVKVEVLDIDERGRYKLRRIVSEEEEQSRENREEPQEKEPEEHVERPAEPKEEPPAFEDRW
ncbi:polyribonucleotide nucleotidyltransferase [Candidatus Bipolaricaulota bacterium]|nr:polyribonucleotide nucleotidyltransferase [Candidatus Bipolaricaulota bacterium]HHR85293.1 polyribonucleotide nucleotidyltransferase [Candidatus Acetothermia bacterium]